jgi:hypothetical protein
MQSVVQFSLPRSGIPFVVQNAVNIQSGGSLSITYTVSGAPATLTITVEGCKNASGDVAVLDSYVGTANTTRAVSLSDTYDYFQITAVWTGGSNVNVSASLSFTGSGQTQTAVTSLIPLSGVGSPQNAVAAPVGTLYSAINGTPGACFFVKTSGGSTSAGWTAVA